MYKNLLKIREVSKKLTRVPKIVYYSSGKWPETDVFCDVIKFETVWPGDLPWRCYALNYGRYVEQGPLEWRNVSFCPLEWLTVILGWKGNETARKRHGMCTLWPKNQWKPHMMSSTRIWKKSGRFRKSWPGCRKSCAIAHENGPKRTFFCDVITFETVWPGNLNCGAMP
jgi:hypothetical protein